MKSISIRELHARTANWCAWPPAIGEIRVTDNGQVVAKIVPHVPAASGPYFSRRQPSAAFKKLDATGKTGCGKDSTAIISQDCEDRG